MPNVNLHDLAGCRSGRGGRAVREELKEKVNALPGGMTKQQFLEHKIHQGLVETKNFDLIVMGRPEGPRLAIAMRTTSSGRSSRHWRNNYQYVVIDNEAGMEHLSRRTTQTHRPSAGCL